MTSAPAPSREREAWLRLHARGRIVAFPAGAIRQILPNEGIVPVPLTREGVAGVIVRDGRAIPVYQMGILIGGEPGRPEAEAADAHVVVVEREGALAGLLVERAEPSRGRPSEEEEIVDGNALLARACLFAAPDGDRDAAEAAGGAPRE